VIPVEVWYPEVKRLYGEDVAQEVALRLCTVKGPIHDPQRFVRRVAYRMSVQVWRRDKRHQLDQAGEGVVIPHPPVQLARVEALEALTHGINEKGVPLTKTQRFRARQWLRARGLVD